VSRRFRNSDDKVNRAKNDHLAKENELFKYIFIMIKSIGIRCNPNEVFFAICEATNETCVVSVVDSIVVPIALEMPEKLKFIRNTMTDILEEYGVTNACIRATEPTAQTLYIPRIYLEGVIQELIASSSISKYYIGHISSISARLGIQRADFKKYISDELDYDKISDWKKFSDLQKESILASISAINI